MLQEAGKIHQISKLCKAGEDGRDKTPCPPGILHIATQALSSPRWGNMQSPSLGHRAAMGTQEPPGSALLTSLGWRSHQPPPHALISCLTVTKGFTSPFCSAPRLPSGAGNFSWHQSSLSCHAPHYFSSQPGLCLQTSPCLQVATQLRRCSQPSLRLCVLALWSNVSSPCRGGCHQWVTQPLQAAGTAAPSTAYGCSSGPCGCHCCSQSTPLTCHCPALPGL